MTTPDLPGELIAGRHALLETVRALGPHAAALILVGAHAVQEWVGQADAEIGFSPGSKEANLHVDLELLLDAPPLQDLMNDAGFALGKHPGVWLSPDGQVDLLVAHEQRSAGDPIGKHEGLHDPSTRSEYVPHDPRLDCRIPNVFAPRVRVTRAFAAILWNTPAAPGRTPRVPADP